MSKKASIVFGIVFAAILGLWLWTIFVPKEYISIGGSTSVDPVMQRLTNKYGQDDDTKGSFVYSSSGSRGGLSNMESGIYEMGFISRDIDSELQTKVVAADEGPKFDVNKPLDKNSEIILDYLETHRKDGEKLNYFQMGIDSIILVYYPTADFAQHYGDKFVIDLTEEKDQRLIFDIYQREVSWFDLAKRLTGETDSQVREKLKNRKNYEAIIPYARETGSGTRNSFEELFEFKKFETGAASKAIESNSNGIMYTGIEAAVNSFGYLSLNYLRSIHLDPNLKTVIISNGANQFNPLDEKNFQDNEVVLENFQNYALTRPYIGLFKANTNEKSLSIFADFFAWMGEALKPNSQSEAAKIYQLEGLIPVLKFNWKLVDGETDNSPE